MFKNNLSEYLTANDMYKEEDEDEMVEEEEEDEME